MLIINKTWYLKNRIKIVWQSERRFNLITDKYNNEVIKQASQTMSFEDINKSKELSEQLNKEIENLSKVLIEFILIDFNFFLYRQTIEKWFIWN